MADNSMKPVNIIAP